MSEISQFDVVLRVLVAAGLGALVGLERERHTVAAGIRTHMLVAVGACLLTGTVQLVAQDLGVSARADVLRIASGIATGVGFIGAGTVIVTGGRVKGLTTAATIWVVAAVGITAGFGFLLLTVLVAGPVTLSILMLGFVEERLQSDGTPKPDYPTTEREAEAEKREVEGAAEEGRTAGEPGAGEAGDDEAQTGLDKWRPRGDG